ncbi:MAG: sucrose phosphorylase [Acidobacteria bacterium]|nr:sucrose phosphorylase [Acidobacteriota bacterium]
MKNQVQLITYVDRLCGDLKRLQSLLQGRFRGLFGGVHLLPFFHPIDGTDAGFDPVDHTQVDARLGDWKDVRTLSEEAEVMADLIVNHVSTASPQFQDFSRKGLSSPFAGMFLTYDRVFPTGAREEELLRIYRPRPGLPFTNALLDSGERRLLWTTFTPQQVDIDVQHPQGEVYLQTILRTFQAAGIRMIRLDAVGYAIKKAGTSCFMIPETFGFIATLASQAHDLGMEVLVEIHSHYSQQLEIARQVDWIYDFALPPLILHSLFARECKALGHWLSVRPKNCITVLDTHDGIGVIDVGAGASGEPGLLEPAEIDSLVETIHSRSKDQSRKATGAAANNLDLYQVNCTFYDALGQSGNEYLIARAVQFFVPGIPQVYYVGLLAGTNDMELLARTQVGRDINRHYYNSTELEESLQSPTVRKLIELIRLRNSHPSFAGAANIETPSDQDLIITWTNDRHWTKLDVDFAKAHAVVTYSRESREGDQQSGHWESRENVSPTKVMQ